MNSKKNKFLGLLISSAFLSMTGCQKYYIVDVAGTRPADVVDVSAWLVKKGRKDQALRVSIENRTSVPLFINWSKSRVEFPLHGARNVDVFPRHKYSFLAPRMDASRSEGIFELFPKGARPLDNVSTGTSRGKPVSGLLPVALFKDNKKPRIGVQLFVCRGFEGQDTLPRNCQTDSNSWFPVVAEATVRLGPQKYKRRR